MVYTSELLLILVISTCTYGKLNWELTTNPIIFGNETILTCYVSNTSCVGSRKWFGGRDNKFLCGENRSSDPNKYELMLRDDVKKFAMKIKQTNLNDVNCKYACSCGFQQFTKDFLLNRSNYVYPPNMSNVEDNSLSNKMMFLVNVTLKRIYPMPRCRIKCHSSKMNQNVPSITENESVVEVHMLDMYSESGVLYNVNLYQRYTAPCIGHLVLTCDVRNYNYTIGNWTSNIWYKDHNTSTNEPVIVLIVFSGIVCVSFFLYLCTKISRDKALSNQRQRTSGRKENSDYHSESLL